MLTDKEIINLPKEDFVKKWNSGEIQDSALKLLGYRDMTEEDKQHVKEQSSE